ncbi:MAG: alpha/beta hydrolase [bacterium]|nr:alpha/beta hydrolase [bacterium]
MNKRVFIVHGWDGTPQEPLFVWLKHRLEEEGYQVQVPAMPDSAYPRIDPWVAHLAEVVGDVDENTFFVGHSIGAQAVLRYLETLPEGKKVGGVVFIAGWFTVKNIQEMEVVEPWLKTPIDFEKIKSHTRKFFAVFSDNDTWVPLGNKDFFEKNLGAETAVESQKGHFTEADGVRDLPVVLKKILEISS